MEDKKLKKETECEETREMETSEIEKLTDDCLVEIFQRLTTIADKIRIERVCKRWRNLSQKSWNNFQSFDLSAKTWGMEKDRHDQRLIRPIDFDKIIRLSGRYLTSISTDIGKFVHVCHLLPKIRKLELIDDCIDKNRKCEKLNFFSHPRNRLVTTRQCTYDSWQVILSWLISHGENITNFKIKFSHSHYKEEDFISLLGKMKQLKSFSLYNCEYLDWRGTVLPELQFEIIQEIIVTSTHMSPFSINVLSTMIQKCKKLQTLGIALVGYKEPRILELLLFQDASLKNLRLKLGDTWSKQWQPALLSTMTALTHLEKLDVSESYAVNDVFLKKVAKSCKKLTYLNLFSCVKVTDRGISSICNLEKLTYLNIRGLPKIRNPPLTKLTRLVVLDLSWSDDIQQECLFILLVKSNQLRVLDVGGGWSVSRKLLNVAIEAAEMRKSNNALDLYCNVSRMDMDILDKKLPFLNILHFDSNHFPLAKYGIGDPFNVETPEIRIESNIV